MENSEESRDWSDFFSTFPAISGIQRQAKKKQNFNSTSRIPNTLFSFSLSYIFLSFNQNSFALIRALVDR